VPDEDRVIVVIPVSEPIYSAMKVVLTHDHIRIIRELPASLRGGRCRPGRRLGGERRPYFRHGTTTLNDARRHEILKQIDEITQQIWEHEESRQKIDQLYEELYQRIKELRDEGRRQGDVSVNPISMA